MCCRLSIFYEKKIPQFSFNFLNFDFFLIFNSCWHNYNISVNMAGKGLLIKLSEIGTNSGSFVPASLSTKQCIVPF